MFIHIQGGESASFFSPFHSAYCDGKLDVLHVLLFLTPCLSDHCHSCCHPGWSESFHLHSCDIHNFSLVIAMGSMLSRLLTLWNWCIFCAILVWSTHPLCQFFVPPLCCFHKNGVIPFAMTVDTVSCLHPFCQDLGTSVFCHTVMGICGMPHAVTVGDLRHGSGWLVPHSIIVLSCAVPGCNVVVVVVLCHILQSPWCSCTVPRFIPVGFHLHALLCPHEVPVQCLAPSLWSSCIFTLEILFFKLSQWWVTCFIHHIILVGSMPWHGEGMCLYHQFKFMCS
jgi:hypothetical protein